MGGLYSFGELHIGDLGEMDGWGKHLRSLSGCTRSTYSMGHKGGKCHQRHLGSGGTSNHKGFFSSPELSSLNMEMESGYKPEGEWISPGKDISAIGEVGNSRIYWEEDHVDPSKSALEVFVGYSEAGPWIPVSNKSVIPGAEAGVDVTGKTLYTRVRGISMDPGYTPELEMLAWEVSQLTDIDLDNHGTANADAIFTGRVVNATNYLQIVHIQTGRQILLNYSFKPGDEFFGQLRDDGDSDQRECSRRTTGV